MSESTKELINRIRREAEGLASTSLPIAPAAGWILALATSLDTRLDNIEGWIKKKQLDEDGGNGPCVPQAEAPERFFHGLWPFPMCCNTQMKPLGNLSLHTLAFRCCMCLKRINATVTFEENATDFADQATINAIDSVE